MPTDPLATTEFSEWIVQARLPQRHVQFTRTIDTRRAIPTAIDQIGPGSRDASLKELYQYLRSVLAVSPVLLKAAGAVSVVASPAEIELISKHPLVKEIQPTRRNRSLVR